MSDYVREKVLRVPFDKYSSSIAKNFPTINIEDDDWCWRIEQQYPDLFNSYEVDKFSASPTVTPFIDFMLDIDYNTDCGEFGKVRDLYDTEKKKYLETFKKVIPDIDMNDVKLVEFCWYNCCEALDYYDTTSDSFYDEV